MDIVTLESAKADALRKHAKKALRLRAARPALDNPPVTVAAPPMNVSLGNQVGGGITSAVTYFPDNAIFNYTHGITALYTGSTSAAIAGDFFYGYGGLTGPAGAWVPFRVSVLTDAMISEWKFLGTAAPRMRFWVDGQLVTWTAATGFVTGGSGTPYSPANSILVPSGASYIGDGKTHYVRLAFATQQLRRITFESDFTYFGGLIVGQADAVGPVRPAYEPRVVVLGDSYTQGSGADAPGTGYAQVLGRQLGWQIRASGAAGTGYIVTNGTGPKLRDRLAADLYPYPADAVLIAMGINDGANPPADVAAEATLVYQAIAANMPNVPVYVIGPWVPNGPPNSSQQALRDAIHTAALAQPNVGGFVDVSNYIPGSGYVGATNGTGPSDRMTGSDHTHPTQVGHEWIGRRIAEDLATIIDAAA